MLLESLVGILMSRTLPDPLSLLLGTAIWVEKGREHCALVAPLPSDPERVVDLHRVEVARLARLGEGRPDTLAEALVPPRLQALLEAGPRALHRARTALAYAEKWRRRGDIPEILAPPLREVRMLACLPHPAALRRTDGSPLEPLLARGPGAMLGCLPRPTLAAVGWTGEGPAGYCLAVEDVRGAVLGAWLNPDFNFRGLLELRMGEHRRTAHMDGWEGLALPPLLPGEVQLLPAPRLRALPELMPGSAFALKAAFETLELSLAEELVHPTLQ